MRQKMRQKMNYKKKIALFFRQVWAVIDKYRAGKQKRVFFQLCTAAGAGGIRH